MNQWIQKTIRLPEYNRGFHLITRKVEEAVPELKQLKVGIANIFLMHTSAGLTLNENADPTVRSDFETHFRAMVPDDSPDFKHTYEGKDDMTAHIKSSILGQSLTIPVCDGRFKLGTWQGIYFCEHRIHGGRRQLVITAHGIENPEDVLVGM